MSRADEILRLLHTAAHYVDPNPGRNHLTGLDHALRCAHLGQQAGHDLAFIGLIHDLARPLTDAHHGQAIAEIARDRVTPDGYHILRTHGDFQTALNHGQPMPHRDATWQRTALRFMAIEERSFHPHCPAITLAEAEDTIRTRFN